MVPDRPDGAAPPRQDAAKAPRRTARSAQHIQALQAIYLGAVEQVACPSCGAAPGSCCHAVADPARRVHPPHARRLRDFTATRMSFRGRR